MSWIAIAIFGYIALAVVFVLDKLILSKSLDNPVVYTFYSTIFMFAVLLAWPFGVQLLQGLDWVWATLSGLGFGFGMWAMFIAVKDGEASHVNPFIGAITTVATFALAFAYLNETLTSGQIWGMVLLACSTFLLAFVKPDGSISFDKSYFWGVLSGILFAISHTTAKHIYDTYDFLSGLVWTRASIGLVGLFTLFYPSVRATFKRKMDESKSVNQVKEKGFAKKHAVAIIVIAKALGVVGVLLIQLAIAIGSVTLVNAMIGLQYAIMFVLIYFLTRYAPKILREDFTKTELAVETFAIILVVIGSGLFVI